MASRIVTRSGGEKVEIKFGSVIGSEITLLIPAYNARFTLTNVGGRVQITERFAIDQAVEAITHVRRSVHASMIQWAASVLRDRARRSQPDNEGDL